MIDSRNPDSRRPYPFKVWHFDEKTGSVTPDMDQWHKRYREEQVALIRDNFTRLKAQLPQRLQK